MLTARLQRERRTQKAGGFGSVCGDNIRHHRFAHGDGSGLVQRDGPHLAHFLQTDGGLEENPVFRAQAAADHDGNRRRQSQRAGAADDQHGNAAREGVGEFFSEKQPDKQRDERDADHHRDEHAGDSVRGLCDRRLGCRRVADHADDLRERGVLSDARGLAAQKTRLIDRCRGDGVSRVLVRRNAFARQRGFVYGAAALQNDAVHRDALSGTHDEDVAFAHLRDGHRDLLPVPEQPRRLGRKPHQAFQGVRCFSLGARFKHLAHGDQRQNHGRGLKIEFVHVGHDALHVSLRLRLRHCEQRIDAPDKGCHGAEGDQRVHIGRAPPEAPEAADKKRLIDDHDDTGQQQLHQSHGHMIPVEPRRQRPAPHHMAHGEVHQHQQEANRRDQAFFQLRRFVIRQGFFPGGDTLRRFVRAGRAVARFLHGAEDALAGRRTLHGHGIGQQAHGTGGDARHLGNRFFHTGAARRAAHARYVVLFHCVSPISSVFARWQSVRRRSRPGLHGDL